MFKITLCKLESKWILLNSFIKQSLSLSIPKQFRLSNTTSYLLYT